MTPYRFRTWKNSLSQILFASILIVAFLAIACISNSENSGTIKNNQDSITPNGSNIISEEKIDTEPLADTQAKKKPVEIDPLVWIDPQKVLQGNAFIIAIDAPNAGFASVAFEGKIITLLREKNRFFTIIGIDALKPIGPMPIVVSIADKDGTQVFQRETLIEILPAGWQIEIVELDETNQDLLDPEIIREDIKERALLQSKKTPERHWDGVFEPPAVGVLTSNYGLLRSYNYGPAEEYHSGLDFAGEIGDPVLAPNSGVVAWVGQTRRRGNGVLIDHGGGIFSGYYHLSETLVTESEIVRTGSLLGRIGATGLATGPHLHWEILAHGVTINPVQWIRLNEFPNPLRELDPANALSQSGFGPN